MRLVGRTETQSRLTPYPHVVVENWEGYLSGWGPHLEWEVSSPYLDSQPRVPVKESGAPTSGLWKSLRLQSVRVQHKTDGKPGVLFKGPHTENKGKLGLSWGQKGRDTTSVYATLTSPTNLLNTWNLRLKPKSTVLKLYIYQDFQVIFRQKVWDA